MSGPPQRGATGAGFVDVAPESFLVHRRMRYLKVMVALLVLTIVAYVAYEPEGGHNGGTWLGYTLGTIGALLILWLTWFGIRKRRYNPGHWNLKGWLSAHVYLGLSLIVIATLHAGFQVGVNIHTLAYLLMLAVILSGVWGVVNYARLPAMMTRNRQSQTLNTMALEMLELDRQAAEHAVPLGDAFADEVRRSRTETQIGGSFFRQLSGRDPRCGTTRALANVRGLAEQVTDDRRDRAGALMVALQRKQELLNRARKDIRYKALMDLWLYVHVPLTFALLAALTAHVISVFYYWG
ncbi:MAG: hypothetical protein R3349_11190 [Geminicoccaceae bacterium]|nr:hypothetical protein [Geminicoccaceae bacterium]